MDIQVQGKEVFVPKAAFVGLSDIVSISVFGNNPKYVLRITGGDASEAYLVVLTFDRKNILSRTAASPTEPDMPTEESVFHAVPVGD